MLTPAARKMLKEFHAHAAPALDDLFKELELAENERPLIGDTSDQTLQRVYRRKGALDVIDEIRSLLRSL